ncbi:AAA family ATPase [Streptomyces sp. NPDC058694]|uniref:helix-turn-helix transcriptional regulator n=1 Tax=Streptomyces sp. NPDC058694 TaxID=3346603 RepID=UPI0036631CBC
MAARTDTELVFGGTAARFHGPGEDLFGRTAESDETDRGLRDPAGPRLTLVRGERGIGRTAFAHATAERLRAAGIAVLPVACVPGDGERPQLLALRLVMALEEHWSATTKRRPAQKPATEALSAMKLGDRTAMAKALATALARPAPAVVLVDDAHHADAESLALLDEADFDRVPPGIRLMLTAAQHTAPSPGRSRAVDSLARNRAAHTITLPRLTPDNATEMVAQRLRSAPDADLMRRLHELSRGVPGALDTLLVEWTAQEAIRTADGHAFLGTGAPVPLLPDHDRYVVALRALEEPCGTVATALSILWPLGRPAEALVASSTGLPAESVTDGIRTLADEGILDELPSRDTDSTPRGWTFRLPLLAHTVRERLGPVKRSHLSAAAVETLWTTGGHAGTGSEADASSPADTRIRTGTGNLAGSETPAGTRTPAEAGTPAAPETTAGIKAPAKTGASAETSTPTDPGTTAGIKTPTKTSTPPEAGTPTNPGAAPRNPPSSPAPAPLLEEADAETYLPDRIADAGFLVDRDRAVTELTAAARSLYPDLERRGMLRWHMGAVRLIEEQYDRDLAILRSGQAAFGCGDYRTARTAAEWLVCGPAEGLDSRTVHEAATLLVASAAAEQDWPTLARMGTALWWEGLPLSAMATVSGRVQALWQLEKWQEALALMLQTERVWQATPSSRALLELFRRVAEYVLGHPDRFARALALPEEPDLPPNKAFAHNIATFDVLLGIGDLRAAANLLSTRRMDVELLPQTNRFLWHHLNGRWDEALALARRLLVDGGVLNVVPGHHLLPARTAAILLAQGRTTSADRLISSVRGKMDGPLEHILDHAEAEVLRTLGELDRAEEVLRRGLHAADERGTFYGIDELLASLAEVQAEAGHKDRATACLTRLEQTAEQMNSGRTRLLHLLTSGRILGPDSPEALKHLHEAVDLARSRSQPFETAVTLLAAVRANAAPATLLHEAYERFGEMGATLWRFHTRTAIREAGLTVPGRRQATAENEHLLATLLAEGLTNRQIAGVLRLSEDAVANRLSRLFARTGMRSRTEVVTAVLKGTQLTPTHH